MCNHLQSLLLTTRCLAFLSRSPKHVGRLQEYDLDGAKQKNDESRELLVLEYHQGNRPTKEAALEQSRERDHTGHVPKPYKEAPSPTQPYWSQRSGLAH